ncbi:MAG: MerR family transcriptional regulator, partial [Persicimonas sp.]
MDESFDKPTLSIGAIAEASGIPRETLRTWERRYGFPDPHRNEAGHRVYSVETLTRLRLISRALDQGHRTGDVVSLDLDELRTLLEATAPRSNARKSDEAPSRQSEPEGDRTWLEPWIKAASEFDGDALASHFWNAWSQLGGLAFLNERIGPFLNEVGEAWAEGRLRVSHEHYASEQLRDFLTRQWRPLSDRARGARLVLASLPGEYHCLGLHMAALTVASAGGRVSFLGSDTPLEEIVAAAEQQRTQAVIISVSRAYEANRARRMLDTLGAAMQQDVLLVVGGGGRPVATNREIHLDDWNELYEWTSQLDETQN